MIPALPQDALRPKPTGLIDDYRRLPHSFIPKYPSNIMMPLPALPHNTIRPKPTGLINDYQQLPHSFIPKYPSNIVMPLPALPHDTPRPKPTGLIDASSGRVWSCKAVNQLVIGRMYGSYDLTLSCCHLRLASQSLFNLTNAELSYFWDAVVIHSSAFAWWSNRIPEDDEGVKKVLENIKTLLDQAG